MRTILYLPLAAWGISFLSLIIQEAPVHAKLSYPANISFHPENSTLAVLQTIATTTWLAQTTLIPSSLAQMNLTASLENSQPSVSHISDVQPTDWAFQAL